MFQIVRKAESKSFILTAGASQVSKLVTSLARDEGYRAIVFVRRSEMIEPLKAWARRTFSSKPIRTSSTSSAPSPGRKSRASCWTQWPTSSPPTSSSPCPTAPNWVIYGKLDSNAISARELGQFIFMSKSITGFWLTEWFRDTRRKKQIRVIGESSNASSTAAGQQMWAEIIPLKNAIEKLPAALAATKREDIALPIRLAFTQFRTRNGFHFRWIALGAVRAFPANFHHRLFRLEALRSEEVLEVVFKPVVMEFEDIAAGIADGNAVSP